MTPTIEKVAIHEIATDRLLLRAWNKKDLIPFAKLNADPVVMNYFPSVMSTEESNILAEKITTKIDANGWGFWAVECLSDKRFIGFVGLNEPHYDMPVYPCFEIGWRLSRDAWGKGYATEAAEACLEFAFSTLKLNQVYSFASLPNIRSRSVMERLGMKNMQANFKHPMIPENLDISEHVLFKIDKSEWAKLHQ